MTNTTTNATAAQSFLLSLGSVLESDEGNWTATITFSLPAYSVARSFTFMNTLKLVAFEGQGIVDIDVLLNMPPFFIGVSSTFLDSAEVRRGENTVISLPNIDDDDSNLDVLEVKIEGCTTSIQPYIELQFDNLAADASTGSIKIKVSLPLNYDEEALDDCIFVYLDDSNENGLNNFYTIDLIIY
jgi:hypothetical protein